MKTMRKIWAILIPLAILTALTACGSRQEAPAVQPANPTEEVTAGEMVQDTSTPLQENDAEEHIDRPDLTGSWEDIDGSTVELTETGPNQFDAVIGIFRLAEFTGFGRLDVLGVNLTLQDPSGGTLYAQFRPQEDGTCTLTVTESV